MKKQRTKEEQGHEGARRRGESVDMVVGRCRETQFFYCTDAYCTLLGLLEARMRFNVLRAYGEGSSRQQTTSIMLVEPRTTQTSGGEDAVRSSRSYVSYARDSGSHKRWWETIWCEVLFTLTVRQCSTFGAWIQVHFMYSNSSPRLVRGNERMDRN